MTPRASITVYDRLGEVSDEVTQASMRGRERVPGTGPYARRMMIYTGQWTFEQRFSGPKVGTQKFAHRHQW